MGNWSGDQPRGKACLFQDTSCVFLFVYLFKELFLKYFMTSVRAHGYVARSQDIERARKFYEETFEMVFEKHDDHGPTHYASLLDGFVFEIYPTTIEVKSRDSFIFSVENLENTLSRVPPERISINPKNTPHGKTAIILDPDGRSLILQQDPPKI